METTRISVSLLIAVNFTPPIWQNGILKQKKSFDIKRLVSNTHFQYFQLRYLKENMILKSWRLKIIPLKNGFSICNYTFLHLDANGQILQSKR